MSSAFRSACRRGVKVWLTLIGLLRLTFGTSYIKLGAWNGALNLAIAAAKALLVVLFFMHLRSARAMLRIAAAIGLFMLALLFGLSHTDYATRGMHRAPWQTPPASSHLGG
jgi:cytochrome c oxidase subunit 4